MHHNSSRAAVSWTLVTVQPRWGHPFFLTMMALLAMAALTYGYAQSEGQDPVVIDYGVDTVTSSEFEREFEIAARAALMQQGSTPTEENLASLEEFRPAFLDQLATQLVLLEEAREKGIEVPDEELSAYLERIRSSLDSTEAYEQYLTEAGFGGEAELRERVAEVMTVQILVDQLATELQPNDEEVSEWFEANGEEFAVAGETPELEAVREEVTMQMTREEVEATIAALRAEANVKVFPENL